VVYTGYTAQQRLPVEHAEEVDFVPCVVMRTGTLLARGQVYGPAFLPRQPKHLHALVQQPSGLGGVVDAHPSLGVEPQVEIHSSKV